MRAPRAEPIPETGRPARGTEGLAFLPLLAWLDRGVCAAIVEPLRADLWLTDLQLGLVGTAFALGAGLAPLAARRLAAAPPSRIGTGGLLVSSLAAVAAAASPGALALLVARAAGGFGAGLRGGEHGGARRRPGLPVAMPLGAAVGLAIGGVTGAYLGWRAALVAAAAAALAGAALCLRGGAGALDATASPAARAADAARLLAARPLGLVVGGLAACAFAASALAFWTPAFLERVRGVPRLLAGVEFGVVVLMSGLAGPFAASAAVGALRKRLRRPEAWVAAGATLAAAPLALAVLFAARPALYLAALVGVLGLLAAAVGPLVATVVATAPIPDRAAALAVALVAFRLAGDAPAAAIVGAISDAASLWWALLAVPAALLVAGGLFGLAASSLERAARREPRDRYPGIIR